MHAKSCIQELHAEMIRFCMRNLSTTELKRFDICSILNKRIIKVRLLQKKPWLEPEEALK